MRKNIFLIPLLILLVSISQFILGKKHLEMGFFTDEWLFLSTYRAYIENPILDILQGWKNIGSHNFGYVYYLGILYSFFGLDYEPYRIFNQILKIIATVCLYPLIWYISKSKILAFVSTLIYAIHFSSFGLLDGISRGGDFLAIALMNIFLTIYLYISKKGMVNTFLLLGLSVWLFTIILIGPTRLFPLLAVIPLIELFKFIFGERPGQLRVSMKRLLVLYFPVLPLFIFSPQSISVQLHYSIGLLDKLKDGNWQLLLVPFAALGSMYIPKDFWFLFGHPSYDNLGSFLSFFLLSFLPIMYIFLFSVIFFISRKPLKFLSRSLGLNILAGVLVFFAAHNWLFLGLLVRAAVDPNTFLLPCLVGLFISINAFCVFLEWRERKESNNLLPFIFIGPVFSLVFISLTWIFADINSIFMGVHAYLTIPAIGTSLALAAIAVIIYQKLYSAKIFGRISSIFFLVIVFLIYFNINLKIVDNFFSYWLKNGASSIDQERIRKQFWNEVDATKKYTFKDLPIVYFSDPEEYENGAFYEQVIVWRIASWFDLEFNSVRERGFQLCTFVVLGKEELKKFITLSKDGKTITDNKCVENKVNVDDFYAFRFKDRNLIPNKGEVIRQLEIR